MLPFFRQPPLPEAARHYPLNLILGWMTESVQPDEAQKKAYREASRRSDVIADNLVASFRDSGAEGRRQFAQAVEQGIASVSDPSPALVAFFAAMDNTPYWVDHTKIRHAQEVMTRISLSTLMPVLVAFGLPASYIVSKVNQTIIRSGDLEQKAASRLIETATWLMHCATPGGLERFAQGFKSTAQVRLVHGYMRVGLNRLPEWDYEQWDHPINQAQQALTMLPFIVGTLLYAPLGNPMTPRDVDAILHFYRYISHLMGIEPALQIGTLQDLRKMLWLTAWSEIQPDEWTPVLNRAMQDAIPAIYGLRQESVSARLLKQYHSDLGRLALGKHYGDALGFRPMSPMVAAVIGVSAINFATNLSLRVLPGGRRLALAVRQRLHARFMAAAARRVAADLSFNRANAKLNQERLTQRPKAVA
ncbi:MAG: Uncharacterized protein K0R03_2203 [Moraxellaceae bacterium]|jgi:hypothetical protein|nr:Uncharacterized protein [Moraxellaceae bacterium]